MESRTIKILTALLAAMTVGAIALIVMETAPISPPQSAFALTNKADNGSEPAVFQTDVPIQATKWRNVIVHSASDGAVEGKFHFVISAEGDISGMVAATKLWKDQLSGGHCNIRGRNFNSDSIGVCLAGDFSRTPPGRTQFHALVRLVRTLQDTLSIPADRVYLYSDLDADSNSPGMAFPTEAFSARLIAGRW